jgi:hypothetical protein
MISSMTEDSIIAVYCNHIDERYNDIPKHIMNRLSLADKLYRRLVASYADESLIKVMLFGSKSAIEMCSKATSMKVSIHECNSIADMASIIMGSLKGDKHTDGDVVRVYFVLSDWQWVYIEPLLRLKDSNARFFFEGASDERSAQDINAERRLESIVKVKGKRGLNALIDKVMSTLASDMKG